MASHRGDQVLDGAESVGGTGGPQASQATHHRETRITCEIPVSATAGTDHDYDYDYVHDQTRGAQAAVAADVTAETEA